MFFAFPHSEKQFKFDIVFCGMIDKYKAVRIINCLLIENIIKLSRLNYIGLQNLTYLRLASFGYFISFLHFL